MSNTISNADKVKKILLRQPQSIKGLSRQIDVEAYTVRAIIADLRERGYKFNVKQYTNPEGHKYNVYRIINTPPK